jgi:Kdo2-lipid IVA lauroyltransferase/acyltransferase
LKPKQLQNYLEYYCFRAFVALLKALPYCISKAFICLLFDAVGYRIGIRKEVALTQMRKVHPSWSLEKIRITLRRMYHQMALDICEIYLMDDSALVRKSRIVGKENVDAALALGRGAILATAHFGNWEAARILPLFDIPVSVITKRQRNRLFDSYTNAIRERNGVRTIDMKRGLRAIIADLRENRMVAILADQNAGSAGLVLDFLGYPASHWKGVAKLSLRYKIPIVPGFVVRDTDDSLRFEFSPMLYYPELSDDDANYGKVLSDITAITERYILQYPEQWFWVHKRWKHDYDMFSD